jgi:hypothetical protein
VLAGVLGRTNASRRFVVWGVMPLGGLIVVALVPSPLLRIRVLEDAERESASVGGPVST